MTDTPICTIDENGIFRPTLSDCLNYFEAGYQAIYGTDVYIASDSQDGQLLGLLAKAIDDVNGATVAAYNSFSPSKARGAGLSSIVKLNGISRKVSTYSTSQILVGGQVGIQIVDGIIFDTNNNTWALPALVTIPPEGQIIVSATATSLGAISAPQGAINSILNAQPGWQSVVNIDDAIPGAPIEKDGELRQRQSYSASLPSLSSLDGLKAALSSVYAVQKSRIWENSTHGVDENGIPAHTIAPVIVGGDARTIANIIALKKSEGVGTYGTTSQTVGPSQFGITQKILFSYANSIKITFYMRVQAFDGFTDDVYAKIQKALSNWITSKDIGEPIYYDEAFEVAKNLGDTSLDTFAYDPDMETFAIVPGTFSLGRDGQPTYAQNIILLYNENAVCLPEYAIIKVI